MKAITLLVAGTTIFLASCTTSYELNVVTIPEGASVLWQSGGGLAGQSPTRLTFEPDARYMQGNCLRISGVTAKWVSGASTNSEPVIRLCNGPGVYNIVLNRPVGFPGLEADVNVAMMILQHRMSIEQIRQHYQRQNNKELGEALGKILATML